MVANEAADIPALVLYCTFNDGVVHLISIDATHEEGD
jgi:hypothetical protein